MTEDERLNREDATWAEYKSARERLRKATCPLERVAMEAQVDSLLIAWMTWAGKSGTFKCYEKRHEFLGDVAGYWS